MHRSSHTGYYQLAEAPSDSEGQETSNTTCIDDAPTSQGVNARQPESRARRTLRSVRQRWKQRKHREHIRSTLPTFRPWFTVIVALVNIGLFVAVCITDGITAITFTPKQEHGIVENFEGDFIAETREEPANFFIGPTATDLVHHGAKYATVRAFHYLLRCTTLSCFIPIVYEERFSFRL